MIDNLAAQPAKLKTMQERNRAFATRINRESYNRLPALLNLPPIPRSPLSEGCGCQKSKQAPAEPTSQPNLDKEL
jgi:hypothetical protein